MTAGGALCAHHPRPHPRLSRPTYLPGSRPLRPALPGGRLAPTNAGSTTCSRDDRPQISYGTSRASYPGHWLNGQPLVTAFRQLTPKSLQTPLEEPGG